VNVRRLVCLLIVLGAALVGSGARARGLDPFRSVGRTKEALDPFRVAQAAPVPAAPAKAAPAPEAKACRVDDDCPAENICSKGTCQAIQVSTNVLYLYYRDGAFREALGLYWSRRGPTGYTVVVPFWWHFWSPTSETTVIVPGLPISWSHEPGASSFAVWPLFYKSSTFGWAVPILGSFAIHDPESGRGLGAVAFLYWWRRTPHHALDIGFPLFASTRSQNDSFTYVLPLNFAWRHNDDERLLVLPLFYGRSHKNGSSFYTLLGYDRREGTRQSGAAFWLYWFANDAKRDEGYDILFPLAWDFWSPRSRSTVAFPLLWHFRTGADNTTVFFPLVWSFKSRDNDTTVAGPWVHVARKGWRFDTVFPLWWSAGDEHGSWKALLPFFYWERSAKDHQLTWVSPLGGYSRDDEQHSKTLVLLPFFVHRRDPARELDILTPFYIRHRALDESDATTRLLGLLLYQRRDAQGSTSVLFPFVWRFHSEPSGATATAVLPFYAHRQGPRDDSVYAGVFPVWFYWRRFPDGGFGTGLFPLAYFGEKAGRSHAVVFPLFWRFKSQQSATTVFVPLFAQHSDPRGFSRVVLPLLWFKGEHGGDAYNVVLPLFWHFSSARESWSTTVTPLGFFHEDRDGWSLGVGPLLPLFYWRSGADRSHAVLFPLFWHFRERDAQRTTTVVGPYVHRTWGDETTDGLFPLLWYRRGARPGGKEETSFTLFPFVHWRRNAQESVLLTLLGGQRVGPHRTVGFIGPYLWYRDADLDASLVPFLYADARRTSTGERTRQWGLWFQLDAPDRKSRVLFPFFGRYEEAHERDTYVFPSYFRQRRDDGTEIDTFMPLFWRSSWGGRTTMVVGPWYDRTAPGVHNTGLVPLYFHARNPQRSWTIIPPLLFVHRHDWTADSERLWVALLWHRRDRESSSTTVFPLWWSGAQAGRTHQVFFPVFWRYTNAEARSTRTLAGPLYWSSWGDGGHTRGLLPLAWYSRDPAAGAASTGVMPLFYESHGPDRSLLVTLLAGYRRTATTRLWYIVPALFTDSIESRFRMVAPFWFSHTNKATETTTSVVVPLYFSRSTPESGLSTVLALFWRHHDIASSTTVGLPLYFDVNDFHASRTSILLPFFVRYKRESDQNVWWVAPIFYHHWSPTDSTTVAFPLYWDFKHPDSRTTVLFPLFGHWRRPTYSSTFVFPDVYHRTGLRPDGTPDGTWRTLVVPFYDAAVKRPGDFTWEVLGGLFGHERIGRNRYLKLFFMTFETEPAPRAQTSWYSKPPPTPRKLAPRGLSMNSW
jgi:hypothetical protein